MTKTILTYACILGCAFMISCKKKRACQCSTTYQQGSQSYTVSSVQDFNTKTTRKTGEKICSQSERQMLKNHQDYLYDGETVTVSCALK